MVEIKVNRKHILISLKILTDYLKHESSNFFFKASDSKYLIFSSLWAIRSLL